MSQERSSFIDALADEFLERHRRGERPQIAQYIARYPQHADEIRELLPTLVMLESLVAGKGKRSRFSLLSGIRRPEILGDYRILQEVGQGGMGIVYEAEQISLGRHVALKALPFQLAGNPRAVQRFQREARAAAYLQHPHIVPVFDFGQDDAVWYYAMQFIQGHPLSAVLNEVRTLLGNSKTASSQNSEQANALAITLLEGEADSQDVTADQDEIEGGRQSNSQGPAPDMDREARLRQIVDDCLLRIHRGEPLSDEEVISRHPDLQPELEEELRMLRLIQASRVPGLVADLNELQARLHPSQEDHSREPVDAATSSEFGAGISSAMRLTGEFELAPARRKRHYFQNVVRLGIDVATALSYAHDRGVIHRDIKPSNLMLDTRGRIWVTDFGLAKLEGGSCTTSHGFVGTLRFMSPEQVHGRCDERSDVYGLGMTIYEMVTLTLPFQGLGNVEVIHHLCHCGPVPPRELDPAIPRDLETIIFKAIARRPSERYQSARALADDLVRFLEQKPIAARRSGLLLRAKMCVERFVEQRFARFARSNDPAWQGESPDELRRQITKLQQENALLKERLATATNSGKGAGDLAQ